MGVCDAGRGSNPYTSILAVAPFPVGAHRIARVRWSVSVISQKADGDAEQDENHESQQSELDDEPDGVEGGVQ